MPAPSEASQLRRALATAPEDVVLALARSGNVAAFEALIGRRHGQVRALLMRLSNDAALADDLAQETFVRAWQGLSSLRADSAFWSWLRRIAVRTWARHARRRPPAADLDAAEIADSDDAGQGAFPDEPADAARSRDLDAALARLSLHARNCSGSGWAPTPRSSRVIDPFLLGHFKRHTDLESESFTRATLMRVVAAHRRRQRWRTAGGGLLAAVLAGTLVHSGALSWMLTVQASAVATLGQVPALPLAPLITLLALVYFSHVARALASFR